MAKIHWNKSADTSLCGLSTITVSVEFTSQGQEVTCERCKRLLPEVRRTAWDLINDEEPPQVQPVEVKKPKKPRAKPRVSRANSQIANFGTAYGTTERSVEASEGKPVEGHLTFTNSGMTKIPITPQQTLRWQWIVGVISLLLPILIVVIFIVFVTGVIR